MAFLVDVIAFIAKNFMSAAPVQTALEQDSNVVFRSSQLFGGVEIFLSPGRKCPSQRKRGEMSSKKSELGGKRFLALPPPPTIKKISPGQWAYRHGWRLATAKLERKILRISMVSLIEKILAPRALTSVLLGGEPHCHDQDDDENEYDCHDWHEFAMRRGIYRVLIQSRLHNGPNRYEGVIWVLTQFD